MTVLTNDQSLLGRRHDLPVMVLSQDYELFFGNSGSLEKCLFEPTDMLTDWARGKGMPITFYVDAGMLVAMEREASADASLQKDLSRVRQHIASLASAGHEIGLHIHPHWEDTKRVDGRWDFSGTRYKLADFSDEEIAGIVGRYASVLNDLCDGTVQTYRAGGFCTEPFVRIRDPLKRAGITVDSSVVPGLRIRDPEKGVDFRAAPRGDWWTFDDTPAVAESGEFLEIPITPQVLPFFHYWGRAFDRLLGRKPASAIGDGLSKKIGWVEILRRLSGGGRCSELSIDAPKTNQLRPDRVLREQRAVVHLMGHPKLLGKTSLEALGSLVEQGGIRSYLSVASLARAIREGA